MEYKVIVIGGVNADIAGTPSDKLIPRDSNPGKITVSPGGVARNIAENLKNLGADVSLIAAIGKDVYGKMIIDSCSRLGIDISLSRITDNEASSVYMYITDETGDMYVAVNDMDIVRQITPEYLSSLDLSGYDACVVDANLTRECLEYICTSLTIPVYADPVSVAKAPKLKGLHFTAVKPNLMESEILRPFCSDRTYISLGKDGIRAVSSDEDLTVAPEFSSSNNANGAGDAAMAAIVFAELQGFDMRRCAEFAVRYSSEKIRNCQP